MNSSPLHCILTSALHVYVNITFLLMFQEKQTCHGSTDYISLLIQRTFDLTLHVCSVITYLNETSKLEMIISRIKICSLNLIKVQKLSFHAIKQLRFFFSPHLFFSAAVDRHSAFVFPECLPLTPSVTLSF